MTEAYIGVDVGTLSARAGVFNSAGRLIASARRPIAIWREPGEIVEQSSDDIWRAATSAVREAVEASGLPPGLFAAWVSTRRVLWWRSIATRVPCRSVRPTRLNAM